MTANSTNTSARSRSRQRGAATLIIVMILFFVVTLAAAYASRNLIFEQRTSANQFRSTGAQEAAEAGIEWALTMLNSGRIDANCLPTTVATQDNFRQRYLDYNSDGSVVPKTLTAAPAAPMWSACVFNGTDWSCYCPNRDGALPSTLPAGAAAFAVRFMGKFEVDERIPLDKPGVVRVEVNGCTSSSLQCLTATQAAANASDCQSTACALLAQLPSVKLRPTAAITAGTTVSGTRLEVYNTDTDTGTGIQAGDVVTVSSLVNGGPGGSPGTVPLPDSGLAGLEAHALDCDRCLFSSIFGLRPSTYREQQGVVQVDCTAGCTSTNSTSPLGKALAAARASSDHPDPASLTTPRPGGSVVWLWGGGGLTLSSATDVIGSPTAPVTLIIDGPLNVTGAARIFGLVYATTAAIDAGPALGPNPPPATIRGALVTSGAVTAAAGPSGDPGRVIYDPAILDDLRKLNGTFVRVPGGWRDFP